MGRVVLESFGLTISELLRFRDAKVWSRPTWSGDASGLGLNVN